MLFYIIIFTLIGIVIGSISRKNEDKAIAIINNLGFSYAPVLRLSSLREIALSYFISRMFK